MAQVITSPTNKHILGNLCKAGHEWGNSGKSLRYKHNGLCVICKRENHKKRMKDPEYAERKKATNQKAQQKRISTEEGRRKLVEAQLRFRRKKIQSDPFFANAERIRGAVRRAINFYFETGKHYESYKYDIDYKGIAEHIGRCPGERSDYHIDHIKPLWLFDLSNPEELKKAFAPENHQWLPYKVNLKKGKKYGHETPQKAIPRAFGI